MNQLDPKTFFFELPIYTPISINQENANDFLKLASFCGTIDYYNPILGENTTYQLSSFEENRDNKYYPYSHSGGYGKAKAVCLRTNEYYYFYVFYDKIRQVLMKVGQYPSIADLNISQIKQYNKIMTKNDLKEFTRAIGLAANGVGIGSFVYLRRIFENLIEEAHSKAKIIEQWDEDTYTHSRMAERIGLLKDYLPEFLVQNRTLYSILSLGIHSLKEEECLAYFDTVKVGIELILDEKMEQYNKQRKMEEATKKIAGITQDVKKN